MPVEIVNINEMIVYKELPSGSYFQFDESVYLKCKIGENYYDFCIADEKLTPCLREHHLVQPLPEPKVTYNFNKE